MAGGGVEEENRQVIWEAVALGGAPARVHQGRPCVAALTAATRELVAVQVDLARRRKAQMRS